MRSHITMEEMESFRRGTLAADQLESVSAHLRDCSECGAAAEGAARALIADFENEEHPEIEELFAYVDGRRQDIAEHLLTCAQCREDVADARSVGQALSLRSVGQALSLPPAESVGQALSLSPRERQAESLPYILLAVAAAVAVVLGLVWFTRQAPAPVNQPSPIIRVVPSPAKSEWDSLIAQARDERGVPPPAIVRQLRGHSDTFRGTHEGHEDLHLSPAGAVVFSQRPEFTWNAKKGERYVVSVVCNDKLATKSEPVSGGRWTPAHPLPRGLVCIWQLERVRDREIIPSPPAPQPAFKVLDEAAAAEIDRAEAQQPRDELAVGLLYARAGVQKDAEEHLQQYVETHPSDTIAPEILQSIERW